MITCTQQARYPSPFAAGAQRERASNQHPNPIMYAQGGLPSYGGAGYSGGGGGGGGYSGGYGYG